MVPRNLIKRQNNLFKRPNNTFEGIGFHCLGAQLILPHINLALFHKPKRSFSLEIKKWRKLG